MDCPRREIWRSQLFKPYKAQRDKVYKSKAWKGGGILRYAHKTLVPELSKSKNFTMLKQKTLEGDDIIAIVCNYVSHNYPEKKIIVITNDHDMLQLVSPNVTLLNLKGQNVNLKSIGTPYEDLLMKVISGDPSDNIKRCFNGCGKKTALKLIKNPEELEKRLTNDPEGKERFEFNRQLIDFNYIPLDIIELFYKNYSSFFKNTVL